MRGASLPPLPSLPPGWTSYTDNTSSKTYYVHLPTGETQWTHPKSQFPTSPSQILNGNIFYKSSSENNEGNIRRSIITLTLISTFIFGYFCGIFFSFAAGSYKKENNLTKLNSQLHKENNYLVGFLHNNVTFGHIHIAKTGGTTLNGLLALNYERVCGHKGYSYDYYRHNIRLFEEKKVTDMYSQVNHGYNRGKVPPKIMHEIGYEDCDWISIEGDYRSWKTFHNWHQPLELHLPCREPIDHLMSQCNFLAHTFNCSSSNLDLEIEKCLVRVNKRFRFGLVDGSIIPEGSVKCYDFNMQFTKYLRLMRDVLQTKKITADYIHRDTNKKRNKTNECIWKNERVKAYTTGFLTNKTDYYSYCDSCIGSNMDLFAV